MADLLGKRIDRCDGTGVLGTIVCTTKDSTWNASLSVLYEIVWDDLSCARKVPFSLIQSNGWKLLPERVEPAECDRIWYDFQIDRTRQMGRCHGSQAKPAPIVVDRQKRLAPYSTSPNPAGAGSFSGVAPAIEIPVITDRPASVQARLLLQEAIAGIQFAVTVDRKRLNVAWLDGPVEAVVMRVLRPLQEAGKVDRIGTRRVSQEATVQAAIDFVLERVWRGEGGRKADEDRMRLSPADVLGGSAAAVMTPMECDIGVVPYSHLVRCVLDRWDAWRGSFVKTERSRYQLAEKDFLFPGGDDAATSLFLDLRHEVDRKRELASGCCDELTLTGKENGIERQRA